MNDLVIRTENLVIFAKLRGTSRPNAVKNALEVVGLAYKDKKIGRAHV